MVAFKKEEIQERLLALIKEIRASAVSVKDTIDRHETTWSTLRGKLFDLLTSIKKLGDLARYMQGGAMENEGSGVRTLKDSAVRWARSVEALATLKDSSVKWARSVEALATQNIDPKYMEFPYQVELSIMEACSKILETLDFYIPILEKELNRDFGSNLTLIQDFVLSFPAYFNGNWAIAVVNLSAMEVMVNKKREEFGLTGPQGSDSDESFYKMYDELRNYLLKKNVDIESEVHSKADVLWNIRNQVMHHGMMLDDESLVLIIKWSRAVINALAVTKV